MTELYPSTWTIFGPKYTAKSSMALTWPKPLAYYDLEKGGIRAWGWNALVMKGDVLPRNIDIPMRSLLKRYQMMRGYIDAWSQFVDLLEADLQNPLIQTVVIDTGSRMRQLIVDAFLEERQKDNPSKKTLDRIEYAQPNRRTEDVMDAPAKRAGKHLVVVYHEADEYAPVIGPDGVPVRDDRGAVKQDITGRMRPDGYSNAESDSDWIIYTSMGKDAKGKPQPRAEILKCPYGLDIIGMKFDWISYEKIVSMLKMMGRV